MKLFQNLVPIKMKLIDIFINLDDYEKIEQPDFDEKNEKSMVLMHKRDKKRFYAKIYKEQSPINGKSQFSIISKCMLIDSLSHPVISSIKGFSFNSISNPFLLEPTILTEYDKELANFQSKVNDDKFTRNKKYIFLLGISHAMKYLHQNNFYFDILKSKNIFIDENFYPRISIIEPIFSSYSQELEINEENLESFNSRDVFSFGKIANIILNFKDNVKENDLVMKSLIEKCTDDDPKKRPTFKRIFDEIWEYLMSFNEDEKEETLKYIENLENHEKNIENEKSGSKFACSEDGFIISGNETEINDKLLKERKQYKLTFERMMKKIDDINEQDAKGDTILHQVCSIGSLSLVKKVCSLKETKIDINNFSYQSISCCSI